jgi:hypothetical protein
MALVHVGGRYFVLETYIIVVEPSSRLYSFAAGCMNMALAVEVA